MMMGLKNRLLNCALAATVILALSLLSFGHRVTVVEGPLVFGPDGSVAVLCLASSEGGTDPHVTQKCDVCRIAQAMLCPSVGSVSVALAWEPVEVVATGASVAGHVLRDYDAAPRAPPV